MEDLINNWNTNTKDLTLRGNLERVYYTGNELDYTVEVGENDIFIFLNQISWNYSGSGTLLTDDQLTWLEKRLEENADKTVYLFFHSFLKNTCGDASNGSARYAASVPLNSTVDKKLRSLLSVYKNIFFFSGHSHWAFEMQFMYNTVTEQYNTYANVYDGGGVYGRMVHSPSVTAPRITDATSSTYWDRPDMQEGYLVYVYGDSVWLRGYDFKNDQYVSYAQYIFDKIELDDRVDSVSLDQNYYKILSGNEVQLSAFVEGAVSSGRKKLIWSCDDGSGKVTVDQNGRVTIAEDAPVSRVTVIATSDADPTKSASVVFDIIPKTVMTGDGSKASPYIIADESNFLTFTNDILLAGKDAAPNKYDGKYIISIWLACPVITEWAAIIGLGVFMMATGIQ